MSITQLTSKGASAISGGITNSRGWIDNQVNKYIVKPKNLKGINGFVFDVEAETNLTLQADITDHFSETNVAMQEHIALKPLKITLSGFVGELSQKKKTGIVGLLNGVQAKLTKIQNYAGKYTPTQLKQIQNAISKAQSTITTIDSYLSKAKNFLGNFTKTTPGITKQQKAYYTLLSFIMTKEPFMIETPYGAMNNMAVESVMFIQPENTKLMSDIKVTFKEIRYVQEISTGFNKDIFQGRAAAQNQAKQNQGVTKGTKVDNSVLYKAIVPAQFQ